MFFGIPRIGSRVNWSITDSASGRTDVYPGRVIDRDRNELSLFVMRKDKDGNEYPAHVLTSTRFIEGRDSLLDEIDAPTVAQLVEKLTTHAQERKAQLAADAVVS